MLKKMSIFFANLCKDEVVKNQVFFVSFVPVSELPAVPALATLLHLGPKLG